MKASHFWISITYVDCHPEAGFWPKDLNVKYLQTRTALGGSLVAFKGS
jgi:hypothetical protein